MTRKILPTPAKDENGFYIKPSAPVPDPDASIDDLLKGGLTLIQRILRVCGEEIATKVVSRECVMNLKDCMNLLLDLKKKESDLLDTMDEEQLRAELDKRQHD